MTLYFTVFRNAIYFSEYRTEHLHLSESTAITQLKLQVGFISCRMQIQTL